MAAIDQGVLDYLNFAAPGCGVNQEYARVVKQTGFTKSVPLGQQCPAGYRAYQPSAEGLPANTINQICIINTPNEAQNAAALPLAMRWSECVSRRPSAPAPPLVCEYCKCPPGSGRVDLACPPQNTACAVCPVAFTPGIPIVPPTAPASVPAPAPATKSELPMWAIILIVIAVFMLVGGLIFLGIKMSR